MLAGRRSTERSGRLVGTDSGAPEARPGHAPCVVVMHGFGGTTSEILPLVHALSARGYAVVAPLLPGHGTTPIALQDTSFETWVDAIQREVTQAIATYGRVVLCGFSLGSLVAMELAARRIEGVVGLVVLGNALTLLGPVRVACELFERNGWSVPDLYLVKLWPADLRDRSQRPRIRTYDRNPLRASFEVYKAGAHVRARLAEISVPTLVLHGALDRVCPKENAEVVRANVGTSSVSVRYFPRSGHIVACDLDREEVAGEVVDFVDRARNAG